MPASSSHFAVSRMPSRPQSWLWLFARPTIEKPIAFRSRATAGTEALVQSPSQEYGAPSIVRGSKIVVSRLPNVTSLPRRMSRTALNRGMDPAYCDSGREMMRSPTAAAAKPSGTLACSSRSIGRFGSSRLASFTTGSAGPKRGSPASAPGAFHTRASAATAVQANRLIG